MRKPLQQVALLCDAAHFTSSEVLDFDEFFYELQQWSFHCHHDVLVSPWLAPAAASLNFKRRFVWELIDSSRSVLFSSFLASSELKDDSVCRR